LNQPLPNTSTPDTFTPDISTRVEEFFRLLERETAEGDFAALAERFAEHFMAASPSGTKIAPRSVFVASMPQRKEMFDKLGAKPAQLVSLEISVLDARYTLAKGRWLLEFAREGHSPQEVFADSTYIVDTGTEPFRITLYMTSQDLPKVLAERGILPDNAETEQP
jgi:hypothetical protein